MLENKKSISNRDNLSLRSETSTAGITLIALIITIIVLLILAGVSISILLGERGIITQATNAKTETNYSENKELLELAVAGAYDDNGTINLDTLKNEVEKIGGTVTGDDFPVILSKENVKLEVDQNGICIEIGTDIKINYTLSKIDGTVINNEEILQEEKINLKISISNIQEFKEIKSMVLKNSDGTEIIGIADLNNGIFECEITENGEYTIIIDAIDKKERNSKYQQIIPINQKISKIQEGWQKADNTNLDNDWYAYKDAEGNIEQVNHPKLGDGMVAIKYVKGIDSTEYEVLTYGSQWANATTRDGSMWVWIPRFAYKITSGYHQSGNDINPDDETLGAGTIEIAFLKDNTNEFLDSSITGEVKTSITDDMYDENGIQQHWLLAPAFTLGEDQLTGFWFAKFEASNVEGYLDNEDTADNANLTLQIKPSVRSWRNISQLNMFKVCQKLSDKNENYYLTYFDKVNNIDTHMTKNVEWGAVAYLAHSTYGLNGNEITKNGSGYYTGGVIYDYYEGGVTYGGNYEYNTSNAIKTSTTQNVYGVYDMSGGTGEYLAACLEGYTNKLTTEDDESFINKYIDLYEEYSVGGYNANKYGDAMYETSNILGTNYPTLSWFGDCSFYMTSDKPVICRGCQYDFGNQAGIFAMGVDRFIWGPSYTFRPVCVVY